MRKILFIMVILLLCSCKTTKYIEVPVTETKIEYRTDSIYIHDKDISADSTYLKDSIVIIATDSVKFVDRWHTLYKYKYLQNTDTVFKDKFIYKTDSIEKPVYITKEVEVNKLYTWQKILMGIGGVVLLTLLGYLGLKIYKLIKK